MADDIRADVEREAYRLYEARGRYAGLDWQDWFDAERIICHRCAGAVDVDAFEFRFRVNLAPGSRVSSQEKSLTLDLPGMLPMAIVGDAPNLADSSRLILKADGWRSKADAERAGSQFGDILTLALVKNQVGIELWARRGGGMFHPAGLRMLEQGDGRPVLNDHLGLMVYPSAPRPVFASMGDATIVVGRSADQICETFRALSITDPQLTDRERVAIDLFNASFFEPAADTRLITLVMAIEALLELQPRSPEAVTLVDSFIEQTRTSGLARKETTSLISTLTYLRNQSIGSAGRELAEARLDGKSYDGVSAPKFFDRCYQLRSTLVHGGDIRSAKEVAGTVAARLQEFVSDLILARFLPVSS